MPFKRIRSKKGGKRMYRSPSGRKFTRKQVNLYYLTGGFKNMRKATKLKRRRKRRRTARRKRRT